MPTITVHGITLDTANYGSGIVTRDGTTPLNSAIWNYATTPTIVAGSGIDVQICITNRTSGNQKAEHYFTVRNGFSTGIVINTDLHFWSADNITTRYPASSGVISPFFWGKSAIYPDQFKVPFLGMDDGIRISTVSQTYALRTQFYGVMTDSLTTYSMQMLGNTGPGGFGLEGRTPIDWYASGESRCFNFYIRIASGTSHSNFLETLDPYINWYKTYYPYNHPPQISGRVMAINLSQADQHTTVITPNDNPRKYIATDPLRQRQLGPTDAFRYPYVHPETATGWIQLLAATVDDRLLKQNNYNTILIWGLTGVTGVVELDYVPSVITNLPSNLLTTLNEISTWSNKHNIDMMVWAGRSPGYYQLSGWNSTVYNLLASGYDILTTGNYDVNLASKWYVSPTGHEQIVKNFNSGIFLYTAGCGFDAAARASEDPWVTGYYSRFRQAFPTKRFAVETVLEDISLNYCPNVYFPHTEFRGRCSFLDVVTSGYQPWVIINYFVDYYLPYVSIAGSSDLQAKEIMYQRVLEIESQGACAVQGFGMGDMIPPTSFIPSSEFLYNECIDFTNKPNSLDCDINPILCSPQNIFPSTGYTFNSNNIYNFVSGVWSSGYTYCMLDGGNMFPLTDIRTKPEFVVNRWLDAAASAFIHAKTHRADLEIGWLGYPCIKGVYESLNYVSNPSNGNYVTGYLNWASGINRINYRYGSLKPWYQYTDFVSPDIRDASGGGPLANYQVWAERTIIENSYYLGQSQVPTYPIYSMYFDRSEPFAGKTLSFSNSQATIDLCITNTNGIILYGKEPSVYLCSGIWQPSPTGLPNWTSINSGSFNIKLAGQSFNIDSLNFTSATGMNHVAAILESGINSKIASTTITPGIYPVPFNVGTVVVTWNNTGYFQFTSMADYIAGGTDLSRGTVAPPDNLSDRTFISISGYSPAGNTNLASGNLLGTFVSFSNLSRNIDEWAGWALPDNWWITYVDNSCDTFTDIEICTSMWPNDMWPSDNAMWHIDMWPYCIEFLIDFTRGCLCLVPTDLVYSYRIDTNYLKTCNLPDVNLITKYSIETNYLQKINIGTDYIQNYYIITNIISSCISVTDFISEYYINTDYLSKCDQVTDFVKTNSSTTDIISSCFAITDIIHNYSLPTMLCINNSDCSCSISMGGVGPGIDI